VVDVAQAAELTGLSTDAIEVRIRRGDLASDFRDGRHEIPLAELQRHDLLVEGGRYRSVLERAESLEGQLRDARESGERARQALKAEQEKVRMMWSMAQQRDWKLRAARERRARLRWPFRRDSSGSAASKES
jgi:hypothetical protein